MSHAEVNEIISKIEPMRKKIRQLEMSSHTEDAAGNSQQAQAIRNTLLKIKLEHRKLEEERDKKMKKVLAS